MKLAAAALLFAACASTGTQAKSTTAAAQDPTEKQVCEVTRVTGTNITRTVCRTQYEADLERQAALDQMREPATLTSGEGEQVSKGHNPFSR